MYPDSVPLEGPYRIPVMLINLVLILATLNVALIYVKKHVFLKDTVKGTRVHAAWATLFLGYAGMIIFYWFGALYTSALGDRYHLLQLGYLSAATGAFFFIYFIEQLTYISARRVFTAMFGVLYAALVVLTILAFIADLGTLVQYFATSFWIPNIGFIAVYFHKMNRLSRGKLRGVSALMVVGFTVLILGILGSTDVIQRSLGLGARVTADIFQIAGVVIVGASSTRVPTWKELGWENAFDTLFIVHKGGILLYEHHFGDKEFRMDGGKLSTAVSVLEAARMFLSAAVGSGELKVLDFERQKLYFETGDHITVVTVANQELDTLGYIIHKIRTEFERTFEGLLSDWNGDNSVFAPARAMINRIMS